MRLYHCLVIQGIDNFEVKRPPDFMIRFTNKIAARRRLYDYLPGLDPSNKVKNDRIKGDRQGL